MDPRTTEVPSGADGILSAQLVGSGKLIDPDRVAALFGHTLDLKSEKVVLTEDITEWNYGEYEGLLVEQIRAGRKERGLGKDKKLDIWRDGCEGVESPQQVIERLNRLIVQI